MALLTKRRRPGPGALLLLLLVGLALAASFSCAHAVRVPAILQDGSIEAAHQGQAPVGSETVSLEHADDNKQVHDEHVSEEVMILSSGSSGGSGGGSRSSGSSGGSGSRSGSGSSSGGSGSRSGGGSRGGGSRSGGGSRGGGSRSGGGSRGTTNDDDDSVFDLSDYDDSSAGAHGGAWTAGVAATVLAVAWLL